MFILEKQNLPQYNIFPDPEFEIGEYYKLINNFDVIGTFINTTNVSKINVSNEEFTISKSLEIFNVTANQKIGKIEISNWKHLFGFKNYIEYLDIKYIFELIQNKDKYSFFHKKTWNKFSFKLYHKNYFTNYDTMSFS